MGSVRNTGENEMTSYSTRALVLSNCLVNSLFWNILPVTSYSRIFCEQPVVYAAANHREISTLPRVRKKNEGRDEKHLLEPWGGYPHRMN